MIRSMSTENKRLIKPNRGTYTDSTGSKGNARYTYKVCTAGTQTCSNEVTVRFGAPRSR